MSPGIIADIKLRLQKKTIYELRQIAREAGVARPADGKKERLTEEIIKIATCEIDPAPRSNRGAPPKSTDYDEKLVADIGECRLYYSALKNGEEVIASGVSDGVRRNECSGVLARNGSGYALQTGCVASQGDVSVHQSFVLRFNLKEGDYIEGVKTGGSPVGGGSALVSLSRINGVRPENLKRIPFENLSAEYPAKRLRIFSRAGDAAARMVDFFAPVGMGQRGIITGGCNSANIALLRQIAAALCLNEGLKVVVHLIAERPEDINSFKNAQCGAELFYTSATDLNRDIVKGAEFVSNFCIRQAECGKNVVLLADGLSRLERASAELGAKGAAKRFLSSAICAGDVSLTILAAISAEDAGLERELEETANMRAHMPLELALQGVDPPVDIIKTYTSDAEPMQTRNELFAAAALRKRVIKGLAEPEEIAAMFKKTANNGQIIRETADV